MSKKSLNNDFFGNIRARNLKSGIAISLLTQQLAQYSFKNLKFGGSMKRHSKIQFM